MKRAIFFAVAVATVILLASPGLEAAGLKQLKLPDIFGQIQNGFKAKAADEVQLYSNQSLDSALPGWNFCSDVFSNDSNDYMIALKLNDAGTKFGFEVYGRLAAGKTFDDLTKASDAYSVIDPTVSPELASAKIIIFTIFLKNMDLMTDPANPNIQWGALILPYVCEQIENNDSSKGQPFKCTEVDGKTFDTNGFSKDELIFLMSEWPLQPIVAYLTPKTPAGSTVQEQLASQCVSYPYTLVNLLYAAKDDSDGDGVPDAYELSASTSECLEGDSDCDGVLDDADLCAGTEAGATVNEDGCSQAQLGDTTEGLTPSEAAGEEGGACSVVPAAPVNPMILLIIAASIGVIARRRRM